MAKDTPKSSASPASAAPAKRLARAKVKKAASTPSEKAMAPGGSRTTKARMAIQAAKDEEARRKERRGETLRKVSIAAFAVVLVVAMMVPSLSAIVTSLRRPDPAASVASVADIDEIYSGEADQLSAALEQDETSVENLLNLGGVYYSWGYGVLSVATTEKDRAHASELFGQAVSCYDRYLQIEDSQDVRVSRAMCLLYAGDTAGAQESLEEVVEAHPDNASAWANLGSIYEGTDVDAAKEAYQNAIAADPDDEQGANSYATSRLSLLEGTETVTGATDDGEAGADATKSKEGTDTPE